MRGKPGHFLVCAVMALACALAGPVRADSFGDLSFSGYADFRVLASAGQAAWLKGGLGKFRYGPESGKALFAEAYGQAVLALGGGLRTIVVARAEPGQAPGIDAMEAYLNTKFISQTGM